MAGKTYTAQEMREYADAMAGDFVDNDYWPVEVTYDAGTVVVECLRQAADAEEENAQLKARLEAVVNMLSNVDHECRYSNAVSMLKDEYDAILHAARGEGGPYAEQ